jgi:hypothetical protein
MKKLFLLFLAAIALVSVTACQGNTDTPNESSSPTASNSGFELPEDKFD